MRFRMPVKLFYASIFETMVAPGSHSLWDIARGRFSGAPAQPFTAPATIPLIIWLLKAKYRTTMGLMVISMAVICSG